MTIIHKKHLEKLYVDLNRREFVSPDPLQFLYEYDDPADREIAGLVASSLAYGRVAQILAGVSRILRVMKSPRQFIEVSSLGELKRAFKGFKHRFTTGADLSNMLIAARRVTGEYGSLGECFKAGIDAKDETSLPALSAFIKRMNAFAGCDLGYLLPSPDGGSACKRPNLFLRWMIRKDAVDPGGWDFISPSKLVVPLDTHMHRVGLAFGFTKRKQADLRAAIEITNEFKRFAPNDPVKYDFALTRLGIRSEMDFDGFLDRIASKS